MSRYGSPAIFNGELYLSHTEASWGAYFQAAGIQAVHEPETFLINTGLATPIYSLYTPDFVLPEHGNTYVEVKNGPIYMDEVLKAMQLARGVGSGVLLLDGKPQNVSVYGFSPQSRKPFQCPKALEGFAAANADIVLHYNRHLMKESSSLTTLIRKYIATANLQRFTAPTQAQLDEYYEHKKQMHNEARRLEVC